MAKYKWVRLVCASVLTLGSLSSVLYPCEAQYRPKLPPKKENVDATDKMTNVVSINGLPDYAGKAKFLGGRKYQNPGGAQYLQEFLAMEKYDQVLDWYRSALTSYKWEITYSDSYHVLARKKSGSSLNIQASPTVSKDGRTRVKITYRDADK